jgi:phosphoribosylanthranilate isomerase
MWIKICGNTNLGDAQMAAQLGADAVGFVFAPSVRQVTPAEVALITPHLPANIERVGVFPAVTDDDAGAEEIARAAQQAGLTAVQLHGGVSLPLLQRLHQLLAGRIQIVQTVHWQVNADTDNSASVSHQLSEISGQGIAERVLIDSKVGLVTGGTGVSFDWDTARAVFTQPACELRLIVAGGLRPDNVTEAIRRLDPWGVDVSSGVEAMPGRKSPEKIAALISNARKAKNSAS